MQNVMTINAETRDNVGKQVTKKLRREGKIPAIIYGGNKESIPITLIVEDVKGILKSEKGENTVLRIHRGDINVDAMLHDIQYDCLTDSIIHVDLLRIDIEKPVTVSVPITIMGQAYGVRVEDGIFDFMTREMKIKCLVTQIPNDFELDVTDLHIGQSVKVEDIDIPEGLQLLSDPQTVICAVSTKAKVEEVVEEVEEEEEAEAAEGEAEEETGDKKDEKETQAKEEK